ncbi:MAG: AzlD domain-containing protein [Lachnospiraceae bacterium]|nr:AzlD domain-containing protein [Lachnospiraceae bacterium]
MSNALFFPYLLLMAGITYLVRAIPFALITKKVQNKRIKSFLYYIPYTVLSAMTVPAIFYATNNPLSAAVGFVAAIVCAMKGRSLTVVAIISCACVFLVQLLV